MKTAALLSLLVSAAVLHAQDFDVRMTNEFAKIVAAGAKLQKLATGFQFTEGPVWLAKDGGYLVFSDIPADELKQWTAQAGVATFRKPSRNANGNTVDRQGRLVTCEHSGRRVSLLDDTGSLLTLADQFEGKKFNSPNDAAVKSDGTIWFTDPDYGLGSAPREQPGCWVYRLDPGAKAIKVVAKDFNKPNGLCFSPDEKRVYIADSGQPHHIRVFDVRSDGSLADGRVFCVIRPGGPDGIRCDAEGRVWSSAGDGVQVFNPSGELIGKILVPETPANLCFGGPDGKTLFITARTSLYSLPVRVHGTK